MGRYVQQYHVHRPVKGVLFDAKAEENIPDLFPFGRISANLS